MIESATYARDESGNIKSIQIVLDGVHYGLTPAGDTWIHKILNDWVAAGNTISG